MVLCGEDEQDTQDRNKTWTPQLQEKQSCDVWRDDGQTQSGTSTATLKSTMDTLVLRCQHTCTVVLPR